MQVARSYYGCWRMVCILVGGASRFSVSAYTNSMVRRVRMSAGDFGGGGHITQQNVAILTKRSCPQQTASAHNKTHIDTQQTIQPIQRKYYAKFLPVFCANLALSLAPRTTST